MILHLIPLNQTLFVPHAYKINTDKFIKYFKTSGNIRHLASDIRLTRVHQLIYHTRYKDMLLYNCYMNTYICCMWGMDIIFVAWKLIS